MIITSMIIKCPHCLYINPVEYKAPAEGISAGVPYRTYMVTSCLNCNYQLTIHVNFAVSKIEADERPKKEPIHFEWVDLQYWRPDAHK